MKSLTTLLKKEVQGNFQWTIKAKQSFEALKGAIVSSSVLITLDLNLPFVVECDTTASGIGGCTYAIKSTGDLF